MIKKFMIIASFLIILSATLAASYNPFEDEIDAMCDNSTGQLMCLTQNYEYDIPIIYTDDIYCLGNTSSFDINTLFICYSEVRPLKVEKFKLDYKRLSTEAEKEEGAGVTTIETREKTYFPNKDIDAIINPEIIQSTKCKLTKNDEGNNYYEFTCSYKGKKQEVSFLVMQDSIVILKAEQGLLTSFITDNLIYILLILIIIAAAYSIVRKKSKLKRRRKK